MSQWANMAAHLLGYVASNNTLRRKYECNNWMLRTNGEAGKQLRVSYEHTCVQSEMNWPIIRASVVNVSSIARGANTWLSKSESRNLESDINYVDYTIQQPAYSLYHLAHLSSSSSAFAQWTCCCFCLGCECSLISWNSSFACVDDLHPTAYRRCQLVLGITILE